MSADILLRFGLAVVIITAGLVAYGLLNRHLLGRAQTHALSLYGALPYKPMIVYVTTPDCAPCKTVQRPALSKLLTLTGDSVQVIEIDATQRPDLAQQWGVMSVPTTFLLDARGEARYVNNGVARFEKLIGQLQTFLDFEI